MNKRDTKNAGWFAEFEARCKAHGIKTGIPMDWLEEYNDLISR